MDRSAAAAEEPLFGKVDGTGIVQSNTELRHTRFDNNNPATSPWTNHTTDYVKLTSAEANKSIGPNMMLKVMAGDIIKISAKYYCLNNPGGGITNPVTTVVTSLVNALLSPDKGSGIGKTYSNDVNTHLTNNDLCTFVSSQPTYGNTSAPKAYINIVFLDEQF